MTAILIFLGVYLLAALAFWAILHGGTRNDPYD
jgi:hypothetical protein